MKRSIALILILGILLTGCSGWLDASYSNVTPNKEDVGYQPNQSLSVSSYSGLYQTMQELVGNGTQSAVLSVANYDQNVVAEDANRAISQLISTDPIAAYAVEQITFELGTNAGQPALALTIRYLHDRTDILKIRPLEDMAGVEEAVAKSLRSCNSGVVLYVSHFTQMDFEQWVRDYGAEHPDVVMEVPAVVENIYPETGDARVVELKFTYQNSRDALRTMQTKVASLFDAAMIYAGDNEDVIDQYFKLYSFLIGLFQQFQLDTSITPAYSLLQHGVGDSRAFAMVYAAMCKKTGLECVMVTGTKNAEPWYWNIIGCDGVYYHVDLVAMQQTDDFVLKTDGEMVGYVWDYSAYPPCTGQEVPPTEETTEQQ